MRQPTVGDSVHYQSYGTPGGEYLPEPRAAIVTQVCAVDCAQTSDEEPRIEYAVGLCILNPTGQFFNTSVPYAEEPTPGHWNWPPLRPRRDFDEARWRQEWEGTWPAPDGPPAVDPITGKAPRS